MPRKYGDAVVLVKKSLDGKISRVNAIVLSSSHRAPLGNDRKVLKDSRGVARPPCEHLTLAVVLPHEGPLKAMNMEQFFTPAYELVPWDEKAVSGWGWELPAGAKADDDSAAGRKNAALHDAKLEHDEKLVAINHQEVERAAAKEALDKKVKQIEQTYQAELAAEKKAAEKAAVDAKAKHEADKKPPVPAPKPAVVGEGFKGSVPKPVPAAGKDLKPATPHATPAAAPVNAPAK